MEPILPCLHPNPGWEDIDHDASPGSEESSDEMIGKHCILELYGCDNAKLNDEAFLRTSLTYAAKQAGAKLLNLITHRFEPQGVTGLALLAESHISIHTWPETGYAAVDVFTCGNHTMPEIACAFISQELEAKNHSLTSLNRATPSVIKSKIRTPISIPSEDLISEKL